jgi:hypothetical protein
LRPVKKLLLQDELNVTRFTGRANIEPLKPFKTFFLFVSFSYRNTPAYPQACWGYAQYRPGYPQFKKVFNPFRIKMHTGCAEVFRG